MGLPRKKNWDQFKKAKKKIGNDIGDETAHIGAKSAKMVSIGASTDRKVSTYEEFVSGENDSIWDMGKRKEQYKKVEESNDENRRLIPGKDYILPGSPEWEAIKKKNGRVLLKDTILNPELLGRIGRRNNDQDDETKSEEWVEESNVIRDLQDDFTDKNVKETKDKIKLFNGGNKGPGEEFLYGDTNTRQTINPQNRTLDLLRLGKQVTFNGWEGFVDKIEGGTVYIRERISGKYHNMTMKEFFKSVKPDENSFHFEKKPKNGKVNEGSRKILKYEDTLDENMLPRPEPQVQCLECGEWIENTLESKIWHLQNIHNIKPDVDDNRIDNALKDYFAVTI